MIKESLEFNKIYMSDDAKSYRTECNDLNEAIEFHTIMVSKLQKKLTETQLAYAKCLGVTDMLKGVNDNGKTA